MGIVGKAALITGASRGIGRAIAIILSKEGVNVAINYYADEKGAEEVRKEAARNGANAVAIKADIRNEKEVKRMVEESAKKLGGIDFLINNAGLDLPATSVEEYSLEKWNAILETNLTGAFLCTRHSIPYLKKSSNPCIVNISSRIGIKPVPNYSAYAASKAAIIAFSKACALELSKYKVRVNVVIPALIDTPLLRRIHSNSKLIDDQIRSSPVGRIGKPEDVANAVLFLIKEESGYINGAEINVDGGLRLI